ncbi:MAG TPA: hypothetical protein VHL52_10885 [Acidimicrobiia bacterium]|nr:hypothetical protein [Acidimicrobiia bacterium]
MAFGGKRDVRGPGHEVDACLRQLLYGTRRVDERHREGGVPFGQDQLQALRLPLFPTQADLPGNLVDESLVLVLTEERRLPQSDAQGRIV